MNDELLKEQLREIGLSVPPTQNTQFTEETRDNNSKEETDSSSTNREENKMNGNTTTPTTSEAPLVPKSESKNEGKAKVKADYLHEVRMGESLNLAKGAASMAAPIAAIGAVTFLAAKALDRILFNESTPLNTDDDILGV